MKTLVAAAVLLQLELLSCHAQQMPEFTIETKQHLAFRSNGESYFLGTQLEDFRAKFGRSEKSEKDDDDEGYLAHTITDYYVSAGLMVTAKSDGRIIGFVFSLVPSPLLKSANVATERGISTGATERDVLKQYGAPYKRKQYKDATSDDTQLFYRYGESVLSFRFERAVLKAISLNADYLPYLEK
ncbi:MAG: hypothetical protein ABR589_05525 [Chthoniobacterales bacterium]